ncbi:MAG: TlpA disulfide reductase family protein [Clostridium sp.]|nr:TlpA disulfide reductase family protein [Clostridium sp.]
MKNKKILILVLGFIVFLGVSYGLYTYLGNSYKPNEVVKEDKGNQDDKNKIVESSEKEKAIDFEIYDYEGNKVTLKDFQGKPIIINVFASWCGPCKAEMPLFENIYKAYKNEDIMLLMINMTDGQRETQKSAEDFMKNEGYTMPIYFDKDLDFSMKYNVMGIPRTLFIDKDGNIIKDHTSMIDAITLNDYIAELLK